MAKAIAIVGGGPKAAAIAAKAVAMRNIGLSAPDVTIFEARSIGSAWKGGDGGYSDGASRLCTPAPRDLGFPYGDDLSASCAGRMFAEFSWASFLVDSGGDQYARWVNRGTPRPTHGEFAQYLEWAVVKAGARVVIDRVTGLSWNGQWGVATRNNGDAGRFDGVVITGPGPPVPALLNRPSNRILDGRNFWTNEALVRSLVAQDRDPTVVIIGAGGTAAAVAGWFVRHNFSRLPIHIVGREATLYTRSPGYFEDRLFSDDDAWDDLPAGARQEFVARLTRGVVWQDVIDGLSRHDNLTYRCGQVVRIDVADDELGVVVGTAGSGCRWSHRDDDAAGFTRRKLSRIRRLVVQLLFQQLGPGKPRAEKRSSDPRGDGNPGSRPCLTFPVSGPPCANEGLNGGTRCCKPDGVGVDVGPDSPTLSGQ
jgi:mycobactin lysine-N-oxygenase